MDKKTSYDILEYASYPRRESCPGRMATVAALLGLETPNIEQCRVLEIGCASGGNIIPLAVSYPSSNFLGIDLSENQIKEGQDTISALKLSNIELKCQSISANQETLGVFDYIICHGVFSWVEKDVQEAILKICSEHLSEKGVAFISYNTLPGWRMQGMLREMMLYHTTIFSEPKEKVEQAIALLHFLGSNTNKEADPFQTFIKDTLGELKRAEPYYIFHEYLEPNNTPFFFHEFLALLAPYNLDYLGDANFPLMSLADFPETTRQLMSELSDDRPKTEQYIDFLRNRKFRETLLVRKGRQIKFPVQPGCIKDFWISSAAKAKEIPQLPANKSDNKFVLQNGGEITVGDPLTRAALEHLGSIWPGRVHFDNLVKTSWKLLNQSGEPSKNDLDTLTKNLFACLEGNLLDVDLYPANYSNVIPEIPTATPLARRQALLGKSATSLRHQRVQLEAITRQVLSLLDGTLNKEALTRKLVSLAKDGYIVLEVAGEDVSDNSERSSILSTVLDRILTQLMHHGFLMN